MITVEVVRSGKTDSIVARSEYSQENVDKMRSVPGARWNPSGKCWSWPFEASIAACMLGTFGSLGKDWLCADRSLFEIALRGPDAESIIADASAVSLPVPGEASPSWPHQTVGFNLISRQAGVLYYWLMGCGKTRGVINAVLGLRIEATLIGAPASVVRGVWKDEFAQHSWREVEIVELGSRSIAERVKQAEAAWQRFHGRVPLVFVINYEAAWSDAFSEWALSRFWGLGVADESQRIMNPSSRTSRFFERLRDRCHRRLCLSGTPMPNGPLDIFGQARFLCPAVFGTNYHAFQTRYALMGGFEGREVKGYQRMEEFKQKFRSFVHYVREVDGLKKQPVNHVRRYFDLPSDAKKIYEGLRADFIADFKGGRITASNSVTRLMRFQQVTSGHAPVDRDDRAAIVEEIHREKAALLKEVLGEVESSEPVVVFCVFTRDLQQVRETAEECGRDYYEISGGADDLAKFKASKKGDVIGVQVRAGGVGINLTRSCYGVLWSINFSLGDYDQLLARQDRPGQHRPVTFIHLVARGTVDETIYRVLNAKRRVTSDVTGSAPSKAEKEKDVQTVMADLLGLSSPSDPALVNIVDVGSEHPNW